MSDNYDWDIGDGMLCEQWGDDDVVHFRTSWHNGEEWVCEEWTEYNTPYANDNDIPWETYIPDYYDDIPF
jgi:hypothetical protein